MRTTPAPRVLSYGAGLDSFALLVEALRRGDRPDVVAFVDVADPAHEDPGEWPSTYRHLAEVVQPLCDREGIAFEIIDADRYPVRDARSLFAWLEARRQIPVAGPHRICTTVAKVERFEAWMHDRWPGAEVEVWLGFEAGEEARAAKDPNAGRPRARRAGRTTRRNRFPLIEWNLCRCRCEALVRAAGYPVPRKSACVFCPYATRGDFQALARELPETFARVAELEASKPPTARGAKLSIKDFRTIRNADGTVREYRSRPLPLLVRGSYRPRARACDVCGATTRATKATGCSYLDAA